MARPVNQWRKDTVPIGGATSASYSIVSTVPGDAGAYDVVVTDACGTVTSAAANLAVLLAPSIFVNPASQNICENDPVTFLVTANGDGLTYQWRQDLVDIGGATNASYMIPMVMAGDAGSYDVVINGSCNIAV